MNYNVSNLYPLPSAWAVNSRGLHPWQFAVRGRTGQFAPWGPGPQWGPFRTDRAGRRDARFARAHQEANSRARRRRVKFFAQLSRKKAGGRPSQSPNGDSVSAAASGAVCQWQTSSTDRRGSGDRPLGNVPPGRSGPEGGAKSRLPPLGDAGAQWAPFSADRGGSRDSLTGPLGPA